MNRIAQVLVYLLFGLARFILIVAGWVFVPVSLLGDGKYRTPKMWRWFGNSADVPVAYSKNRWTLYKWMAWRNPVEGLDSTLKQPIPEKTPNPDELVRVRKLPKATRFMEHGIFWEYWYLKAMKNGKFFEFRIGWKFVDGNEDFVPTFQLGPKE